MSDITENPEKADSTVENPAQNSEKMFKQVDVDRIVKERLDREKTSYKKSIDDASSREADLKTQVDSLEGILKKTVESEIKNLPENIQKLVSKLSLVEQYEYLTDPNNKIEKKTIPETPKGDSWNGDKSKTKKINNFF